jgi:hypothetical protein
MPGILEIETADGVQAVDEEVQRCRGMYSGLGQFYVTIETRIR